jgi:mannopine transport system permease protein
MTASLQRLRRGRSARRFSPLASWLLLSGVIVFLGLLFFLPVFEVLTQSLFDPRFTTANYTLLFQEPLYLRVLQRTVQISFAVAVLCVVLGYPVAFLMARSSGLVVAIVGACVLIPLWTSVLVRSYAWIVMLQRNGLINQWFTSLGLIDRPLRMIYTDGAVILAMVHVLLPFVILPLYGSLKGIPDDLYKAAGISGAGAWGTFRHVVVPLSLPGVSAGFALVFIQALGFFVTPALVGGPQSMMIATLIGKEIRDGTSWGVACALAALLLAATLAFMFVFNRALRIERIAGEQR